MRTATITAPAHTATITAPAPGLPAAPAQTAEISAAHDRQAVVDLPLTVRRATISDDAAVARLAALDSARTPSGPLVLAESHGELRAALSLTDGTVIADPFHPTAAIVALLASVAAPASAPAQGGIRRRLRRPRRRR